MLHTVVGDHAAAQFTGGSFGQCDHRVIADGIIDNLFAFSSFAKHAADVWSDEEHLGNAGTTFYAEVVTSGTTRCTEERGHALSSCDRVFEVWSVWKDYFDEPFCNLTSARIGLATILAKDRHEFLGNEEAN